MIIVIDNRMDLSMHFKTAESLLETIQRAVLENSETEYLFFSLNLLSAYFEGIKKILDDNDIRIG